MCPPCSPPQELKVVLRSRSYLLAYHTRNGEVGALAAATGTSRSFAGRVISACKAGTEGELYRRRRRRDAVGKELLQELEEYLLLPRISRCCPGETVSVGYGRRKEKHRMKVSKEAALKGMPY